MNIVSSLLFLYSGQTNLFLILTVSALFAFIENGIVIVATFHFLKNIVFFVFSLFLNVVIVVDAFLIYKFARVLDVEILDTILATNRVEAGEFVETYISVPLILLFLVLLLGVNCGILKASKLLVKFVYVRRILMALCVIAIAIYGYHTFAFIFNKKEPRLALTQQNALPRIVYTWYLATYDEHIGDILHICETVSAIRTQKSPEKLIVVIGESFSIAHSSLYGYEKETSPLLDERRRKGEITVYKDVVSVADITYTAMKSIFSLDSLGTDFYSSPLFPACFRAAGFYSAMYDNEYLVDDVAFHGRFILANQRLSEVLFDYRNSETYTYDGDMVEEITQKRDVPVLYVVHLWGQHPVYEKRYPENFKKFVASDYTNTRLTAAQREIVANYDNATLYNDYVVNEIIKKFEGDDCCLVYFSDHGEELFENQDYYGHGTAASSLDLRYQIRVPLLVWTSDKFKERNPNMVDLLREQQDVPIITDDISHFLLKIGGIMSSCYNPQRCFIDTQYNRNKPRIVLSGIDYDVYKSSLPSK